jgi:hypothetical protein
MNTTTKKAANSIVGKLTAGILSGAAVALVGMASSAFAFQGGDAVLVIGDSLEVGSGGYLEQALAGVPVQIDAKRSRTSSAGVRALAERLRPQHGTIVFPLGTNDRSVETLAASFAAVRQLAGGRCLVAATISRPSRYGASAAALNDVVRRSADQVADWASAASSPGVLGRDRIHATGQGYALRGTLLAEAVQGCQLTGIPAPRNPNAKPPPRRRAPRPDPAPRRSPAPPARLPAPAALEAVSSALARVGSMVVAAGEAARTAASKPAPEPVLGARPLP